MVTCEKTCWLASRMKSAVANNKTFGKKQSKGKKLSRDITIYPAINRF